MSEQMNQMLSDSGLPLYEKAVVFAAIAHQGAHRKGSRIPYLSHPIEAAAIVSELTDDEELIAAAVLREKLSKWFFFGFVCAMAGVALVSLAGVSELHFSPVGALLGVGAALVWGVYSVLVRQLGHMGYRTIPLTCRIFGYGLLFLLVPAVIEGFPSGLSVWTQPVHLANLLFLGLCASATCFVTWNRAVFLLGPVKTSVYIYATPVITIVSSALILHETMTPIMWLGTVLALGGLILSEHREKEKTTA